MKFSAPAKLILSGEHAVVHGGPALAMAVNYFATTEALHQSPELFSLRFSELHYQESLDLNRLADTREQVERRYKLFQQENVPIDQVLADPAELLVYALSLIVPLYQIDQGMRITLNSNIPLGCGMGSSAASIVSFMQAVTSSAGFTIAPIELYPLALTVENMQHGNSGGIDVLLALRGGCVFKQGELFSPRPISTMPLYLVNTGMPDTTTGECVAAVKPYFNGENDNLLADFSAVTKAMDKAWQANDVKQMAKAIRENHRLLVKIGVVPELVQDFIAELELHDMAAKICGAGAINGENAGVVMILAEDEDALETICHEFNYTYAPVVGEVRGVHEL